MGQQARDDGNRCKARVRCLYFCCASLDSFGFSSGFPTFFSQGSLVVFSAGSDIQVTSQIRGIIDGTITDFEDFDQKLALKDRAKQIRQADLFRG